MSYSIDGTGEPVLFIQGTGVHGSGWRPQIEQLKERYRCLSFDHRGIGKSQPNSASITVEQLAEDSGALMDSQGWESAHVVGHSLGGLVALHLALSARSKVRSLSLICSFARGSDATKMSWSMALLGLRTYIGTRAMRRRAFTEMILPPDPLTKFDRDKLAAELAPIFGHDLAEQPPMVMKQLAAMRKYDATPKLGELAGLPTLIIGARHDRIARPEMVRELVTGIPSAKFHEIADAAHGAPIQFARQVNELLHEHFAEVEKLRRS